MEVNQRLAEGCISNLNFGEHMKGQDGRTRRRERVAPSDSEQDGTQALMLSMNTKVLF